MGLTKEDSDKFAEQLEKKSLTYTVCPMANLVEELKKIIHRHFGFTGQEVSIKLNNFLPALRNDLFALIEYPYVDKVYRDTYYIHFSSKHNHYNRDCIRICFFEKPFADQTFLSEEGRQTLRDSFVGYMVIRPTLSNIIGRSMLSPKAMTDHRFSICAVKTEVMVKGLKLTINAYPHSTQDNEIMTCAETTIWNTMEYFGNKYADYQPVLPSQIIRTLSSRAYERQVPSLGLPADHISYALKQFGFGVKLYQQKDHNLPRVLAYYVESGIPVIGFMSGKTLLNNGKYFSVCHAYTVVGQREITESSIRALPEQKVNVDGHEIVVSDLADCAREFVVSDDNYPVYRCTPFMPPTSYYGPMPGWKDCEMNYLIVPLYPRVFLEATSARKLVIEIICTPDFQFHEFGATVVFRLFLASSRTFKSTIVNNLSLSEELRNLILLKSMPKFIWVAEIGTNESFIKKESMGMVILDATAWTGPPLNSLIMFANPKKHFHVFKSRDKTEIIGIEYKSLSLPPFKIFENNLKKVIKVEEKKSGDNSL